MLCCPAPRYFLRLRVGGIRLRRLLARVILSRRREEQCVSYHRTQFAIRRGERNEWHILNRRHDEIETTEWLHPCIVVRKFHGQCRSDYGRRTCGHELGCHAGRICHTRCRRSADQVAKLATASEPGESLRRSLPSGCRNSVRQRVQCDGMEAPVRLAVDAAAVRRTELCPVGA
jgi:hypothetical protein